MTNDEKKKLKALIHGIRLMRSRVARNAYEIYSPIDKHTGMCGAASELYNQSRISSDVYDSLNRIIRHGCGTYAWFTGRVAVLNEQLLKQRITGFFSSDECQEFRHMWMNQLIRDYTRMLKEGNTDANSSETKA